MILKNTSKIEVAEPKEDEAKERHKKDLIKAIRIIVDSIKDHLIPQVSSKKTLDQIFWVDRSLENPNPSLAVNHKNCIKTELEKLHYCNFASRI